DRRDPTSLAVGQGHVQPSRKCLTKLVQRKFCQSPRNGRITGWLASSKPQRLPQVIPMNGGPAHQNGHFCNSPDQSKKNERHDTLVRMADATRLTRVSKMRKNCSQLRYC